MTFEITVKPIQIIFSRVNGLNDKPIFYAATHKYLTMEELLTYKMKNVHDIRSRLFGG